jgi:hypothetical protein
MVKILTFGANKYDEDNWKRVENWRVRYYDAAMRHLTEHTLGLELDRESGCLHLCHAMTCLYFLYELTKKEKATKCGGNCNDCKEN